MKKVLLTILSIVPVKSIAIAAESSKLHLIGEEQQAILKQILDSTRLTILPRGVASTTRGDALIRLSKIYRTDDLSFLNSKLHEHLELLRKNGILTFDEHDILSSNPSPDFR